MHMLYTQALSQIKQLAQQPESITEGPEGPFVLDLVRKRVFFRDDENFYGQENFYGNFPSRNLTTTPI